MVIGRGKWGRGTGEGKGEINGDKTNKHRVTEKRS